MKNLLSTKEVASYLGVNEKMVYSLISEKGLPATKITGKWLFPAHLVEQWVERSTMNIPEETPKQTASGSVPPLSIQRPVVPEETLIIAGSNDLLLEQTIRLFMEKNPEHLVAFANLGSLEGIRAVSRGACHIATSHLMQEDEEDYNFDHVERELSESPAIINFCYREQGFVTAKGNPHDISSVQDIAEKGLCYVNRSTGTGTRLLFDKELAKYNISVDTICGYANEAARHLDIGLEIVSGRADVGLAIRPVAETLGLGFVPLKYERFDLIIPRAFYFDKPVQQFLATFMTPEFRELVDSMPGYNLQRSGRVLYRGDDKK